jgi:hypothetical protein
MLSLLGNRFLTFNSVIRVNQIEARRDLDLGEDEAPLHTPDGVAALREAVRLGWPDARMTWALSWQALQDDRPNYRQIRELVVSYHRQYGDEVTFIPGAFFANAYNTRQEINRDLHEGLARASAIVGANYRPASVVAGFLAAENHRYLAEAEGIHVCQGNIWSQLAIDYQDGDGSICYPYYPSREHFCKPAQGPDDFIDCVTLDGWTCDFLAARREGFAEGFNSRLGVGPIETIMHYGPEIGLRQVLATTAAHFGQGYALNGFAWVTVCWEASLGALGADLPALTRWLAETRHRWPTARCVTQGEYGLAWRRHYRDNGPIDYRFVQEGSGIGGSDADKQIRWFMNKGFRLAVLKGLRPGSPSLVIDYTRYDLPAAEPQALTRNWSLLGTINQKQTRPQDRPRPFAELPAEEQERILARYPELAAL